MARQECILTARSVEAAIRRGTGKHGDGGGLYLILKGSRQGWSFCFTFQGRGREMGLGAYPAVTLAEARKARDKWRKVLNEGANPIEVREASKKAPPGKRTFGQVADEFLAGRIKTGVWRHEKTPHQ